MGIEGKKKEPPQFIGGKAVHRSRLRILADTQLDHLLRDSAFVADWKELYAACPWVTAFQSFEFVSTWYDVYKDDYQPLLLRGLQDGRLVGLFPLARQRRNGRVTIAGYPHAEYEAWLSYPENNSFIVAALGHLQKLRPAVRLEFLHLPPGIPLDWVASNPLGRMCLLVPHERPLMDIDLDQIYRRLSKKTMKLHLHRLQRLGAVRCERVTNEDLPEILNVVLAQYEVRQIAKYHNPGLPIDRLFRQFYLRLGQFSDLLHVSVLRVGQTVAAANIGLHWHGVVHLGAITHAPQLARHGPGMLHILMLGQLLAAESKATFDLTPGEAAYKDKFANRYETVHQFTFFPNIRHRVTTQLYELSKRLFKIIVRKVRGNYKPFKKPLSELLQDGRFWIERQIKPATVLFYLAINPSNKSYETPRAARDAADLLRYVPGSDGPTLQIFLHHALTRWERGADCYTRIEGQRLVACAWVVHSKHRLQAYDGLPDIPTKTSLLFDFYANTSVSRIQAFKTAIQQLISESSAAGDERFLVRVNTRDTDARKQLAALSFLPFNASELTKLQYTNAAQRCPASS